MKVSVVIPTYNRLDRLPQTLDSVLSQTRAADEIIVVDDGSTDGTASMLCRDYPQIRLLSQGNAGVSNARNHGIREADGDWIALLDSDDHWHPQRLEVQLAKVGRHRLIHANEIWVRQGRRVNPHNKHRKSGGWIFQQCLPLCVISPSATLIRREVFDELGWFDETLPACEDYDYWLRLCAREPVAYVEEPLITKHGGHADQLSQHYPAMDRFRIQALAALLEQNCLDEQQHHQALNMLRNKSRIYINGARKRGKLQTIAEFEARYRHLL